MTSLELTIKKAHKEHTKMLVMGLGYAGAIALGLHRYIPFISVNWLLGVFALITTWQVDPAKKTSDRFAWLALAFTVLYLAMPAKTLLFLAIGSAVFYLVENAWGRIGYLSGLALMIMSPIFEYFSSVFSFPLRLKLTSIAGGLMQWTGGQVHAEGNVLAGADTEFSVDPVCLGLHMLTASLLAGLVMIGIFEKKYFKKMPALTTVAALLAIVLLNLACNLLRIICLVHFKIGPDSLWHQLMGVCCFVVYVLIPAAVLIRWMALRSPGYLPGHAGAFRLSRSQFLRNILLLTVIVAVILLNKSQNGSAIVKVKPVSTAGYRSVQLDDHITKMENGGALIYIKPIGGFFSSDHQPTLCWAGSGYQFRKVEENRVGAMQVYSAVLEKKKALLYTAWWYDNGSQTTISQADWRWHAFSRSDKYALINVTAASPESLKEEIEKFAALHVFKKMISP